MQMHTPNIYVMDDKKILLFTICLRLIFRKIGLRNRLS